MPGTAKVPESKVSPKAPQRKTSTSKVTPGPSKDLLGTGGASGTKSGGGGAAGTRVTTTATTKRTVALSPKAAGSEAKTAKRTGEDAALEATRRSVKSPKGTKETKAVSDGPFSVSRMQKQSELRKNKTKNDAAHNFPKKPDGEDVSKFRHSKALTSVLGNNMLASTASPTGAGKKASDEPKLAGVAAAAPKDDGKGGAKPDSRAPNDKFRHRRERRKSILLVPIAKVIRSKVFRKAIGRGRLDDDDSEATLSSKEELSLVFVVMLAAFLFFFMLALLVYYFISGPNLPIAVACISDECLKAKEYLDGLLNNSKDPCGNFYGHVCDSWRNTNSSFHENVVSKELLMLNRSLFQDVKVTEDDEKRYGVHVLRPVYRSCYRYMSEAIDMKDALKEAYELLDITELANAASFFGVVRYLVRQVIQTGLFTIFKAMFVYENGGTVLFMGRGYSLSDKLGVPFDSSDMRGRFEEIIKFWVGREDVKADLDLLAKIDNRVNTIFRDVPMKEEKQSFHDVVSGMVANVSPEQWLLAIKDAHRENFVLQMTDDIIVDATASIRQAMQMVVGYGLSNASFYLATNIEADVAYIISMREKIAQSEAAKAFYCLQFTYRCLTLTWAFLAARYVASAPSIRVLNDILDAIQDTMAEEDDTLTWMSKSTTRKATVEALSKVSLHVIAGRRFNASNVDYNEADVNLNEGEKFFKVLLAALKLHHRVMAANPPTRIELLISELQFTSTISFVSEGNYIVVPTLYQRIPYLYNFDVPDYYNYGTMGALLGVQLAKIAGVGINDERQSAWDTSSVSQHTRMLECLVKRRRLLGFPDFSPSKGIKQQTQLLTLTIGARLAFSALKNIFRRKSGTAKVFNDYWPEALRVFFTRYCLLWCSSSVKADPMTPRGKCMLPLYNIEEFGEVYNCHANHTGGAVCQT